MKIKPLDVGLEAVTRWQVEDDIHLPKSRGLSPTFLPLDRPLDNVLKLPTLDERLPALMQPRNVDPDLLQPAALEAVRQSVGQRLAEAARRNVGRKRDLFQAAAKIMEDEITLSDAVREALAALMKG